MGENTAIEWTDSTWNPIRARLWAIQSDGSGKERIGWHCEHVSEGCRNCYAERINLRLGTGFEFKPGNLRGKPGHYGGGIDWPELFLDEKMLLAPLRWKKPRHIFVNSMSDTFAEFVTDEWIDRMFAVMALCPQHTFQVLTKRAGGMREWFAEDQRDHYVDCEMEKIAPQHWCARELQDYGGWPLKNVWLGVSAERQQEADERIPDLLETPAAMRFVSLEPLLGPIDLIQCKALTVETPGMEPAGCIDWAIVGGESGPHARPMMIEWVRELRDQCDAAGIPYFFKQWGEHRPDDPCAFHTAMVRVGKKAAGRLLDGVQHDGMPS